MRTLFCFSHVTSGIVSPHPEPLVEDLNVPEGNVACGDEQKTVTNKVLT